MAEKKFSDLTAKGAALADTDLLAISESAGGGAYTSKSVTGANVKALVTDANLTTTDVTTNNVSTSKHGFAPKSPNDGTQFLDGLGAYDTVKDSDLSLSDITTNDVSTTKHGFVPKAPNDTTKFLRGDGTWQTPAAGGLTKFTEAEATTSPNNTVYVDSLTAAASTTDADFAIRPKGAGALITKIPDSSTNGNKRGQYAVDLQLSTNFSTRVASGNYSAIIGGANNTSSGDYSLSSGIYSIASGSASVALSAATSSSTYSIALGQSSTASADGAVALSRNNTSSGQRSFTVGIDNIASAAESAAIGNACTASGVQSMATGLEANTDSVQCRQGHGNGANHQTSKWLLKRDTTNNTLTYLTTNGVDEFTGGTPNMFLLRNNNAFRFTGTIIGKKSGSADVAAWDINGLIVRGANAAATTLVVSTVTVVDNTPAWGTPTLTANTTRGGMSISVTGAASTNIRWTAYLETTEVIYA